MTPNSFDLSHSRVIAASMHPCCDFVRTSYCTSLLAAESEVRSQEGRQTEMDHRTACLPVWSNSVYGSRCPRPTTPLAEMQAQVTAVVSHVSRCNCSATNLTLNSSIETTMDSPGACVFQSPPCRSQTAFCCGVMAALGMSSQPTSSSTCPTSRSDSPPWS